LEWFLGYKNAKKFLFMVFIVQLFLQLWTNRVFLTRYSYLKALNLGFV
jgi:hypothetical protein